MKSLDTKSRQEVGQVGAKALQVAWRCLRTMPGPCAMSVPSHECIVHRPGRLVIYKVDKGQGNVVPGLLMVRDMNKVIFARHDGIQVLHQPVI